MDRDDTGVNGLSDDDGAYSSEALYESESVIRPDIEWRGPRVNGAAAHKLTPVSGVEARRQPANRDSESPDLEQTIIGSSPQAKLLRERIRMYAADTAPILIAGETGVGKELVANALHGLSDRTDMPFVAVNAGAIPETLAAAELFGHTKGAFTGAQSDREGAFALADGGMLFLDEIGDMPLSVQAQLLRVLDDGFVTKIGTRAATHVDFRLVAATNVDLRRSVAAGQFRRDLFHRINVLVIDVPPLRARGDDVLEIAESLILNHPNKSFRRASLTPNAADKIRSYAFPGNVRELKNTLSRALVHAQGGKIFTEHLAFSECGGGTGTAAELKIADAKDLISRFVVLRALEKTGGNVTKAAELTGRARGTVHAVMKQLNGEDFAAELSAARAQIQALIDNC